MKKTFYIVLAAMVAMGAVSAAEPAPVVVKLTENETALKGTSVDCNGAPFTTVPSQPWLNNQALGDTGISVTLNGSVNGKMWANNYTTTADGWTNKAALAEMTGNLGTSVTAAGLIDAGFIAPGAGGSKAKDITFTFAEKSGYTSGSHFVMYVALSQGAESARDNLSAVSVASGLVNSSVTYATATGSGFGSSLSGMGTGVLAIARIEGTLAQGASAVKLNFTSGGVRNGIGVLAFAPTTLTATAVEGQYDAVANRLTLKVNENLFAYTQDGTIALNVNITDSLWDTLLPEMAGAPDGMVHVSVTDGSLSPLAKGATPTVINLDDYKGVVTLNNSYVGEAGAGADGSRLFQVQYIPEPATATLSLLALAGLAARRRRK